MTVCDVDTESEELGQGASECDREVESPRMEQWHPAECLSKKRIVW